jgi:GNAT superfamily N-acetyltransferase
VERAASNSMCFGLFHERDGQVGYARVVSDKVTFAYLADVFVLESHRGKGLSKWLVQAILAGAAVKLGCDHTHYPAHVSLPADTLASLAGDLR